MQSTIYDHFHEGFFTDISSDTLATLIIIDKLSLHLMTIAKQTQEEHYQALYQWTHQKVKRNYYDCEYCKSVTLARISNNDLYGCSTGYQDYTLA